MAFENLSRERGGPGADDLAALRVRLPGIAEPDRQGVFDSVWLRLSIVIASLVAYAFLCLWLAPLMGPTAGVLAIVPVTVGGFMFGVRGGVLVGIAAVPSNGVLLSIADPTGDGVIFSIGDIPAAMTLILAGGLTGKLRDLVGEVSTRLADREIAHEEVRRLGHQNYLLLNAVGEGVCGIDLAGNVTFANSAAGHMLRRHPEELKGRPFDRVFRGARMPGSGGQSSAEMVKQALTRGQWAQDQEIELVHRDETRLPVEFHVTPVLDDEDVITGAVVTFHDITERVRTANAWKESEAQTQERNTLTAIQSSISEGLVVLDPTGRVKYFNQAAEVLIGVLSASVIGEKFLDVISNQAEKFSDEESYQRMIAMIKVDDTPADSITVELDKPEHVEVGVSRFSIPTSGTESMMGLILRDVTLEKEVERRRDTFVSVASHELRTPMTSILGFSELLKSRNPSPEVRQSWVNAIYEESLHITTIVDDMLNVARIQSGKMHVDAEMIDVIEIVSEVGQTISDMSPEHTIDVLPADGLAPAIADRFKLAQVLTNLMENAIKYTPAGGRVTVGARHDAVAGRIVVSVTDTGIGISADDSDRLFTTFHRIRRPETDKIKGTGLGLYIVKALVELMGGEVWLESQLNVGTTFFFSLPAKATELKMSA